MEDEASSVNSDKELEQLELEEEKIDTLSTRTPYVHHFDPNLPKAKAVPRTKNGTITKYGVFILKDPRIRVRDSTNRAREEKKKIAREERRRKQEELVAREVARRLQEFQVGWESVPNVFNSKDQNVCPGAPCWCSISPREIMIFETTWL